MHKNSRWLMAWDDRMIAKYGNKEDWCGKLARYMNEDGNEYPSNEAIFVATSWEEKLPVTD